MRAKFSAEHYEVIAAAIKEANATLSEEQHKVGIAYLSGILARRFEADNPRFDVPKFAAACGIEPVEADYERFHKES